MGFKPLRLVRSLDDFGHTIKVTYKGEESFQTVCGGVFTIVARVIILIAISRAASEVISMQEPDIKSLSR